MRDYEELPADIPQSLKTVIAKSLAKLPENRYQTAVEMREDLQKIQRGENVSASIQTNFDKPIPDSAIPPTEKVTVDSARNLQSETETVVRPVLTFGQDEERKSFNIWMVAVGLILLSAIGLGAYFLTNQSNQTDSSKNEIAKARQTQPHNDLVNSKSVNTATNVNLDMNKPTPAPSVTATVTDKKVIWDSFYAKFVSAVNRQDKKALMQMMPNDFHPSPGYATGSEWLEYIHDEEWRDLQKSISQGTIVEKDWSNNGIPTRVTKDNRYYFEFRKNKKWYFAGEIEITPDDY